MPDLVTMACTLLGGELVIAIIVLVSLLSMMVCYWIASSRKADRWYWMVIGLLFGPLAIPFAFLSKPTRL